MNGNENSSGSPPLKSYEEGLIEKRLAALGESRDEPDALEPYRAAAAVLTCFDPVVLQPIGGRPKGSMVSGLDLLPELLPAPPPLREAGLWTLTDSQRRWTLQSLGTRERMIEALETNPDRPDDSIQRVFERVLQSNQPLEVTEFAGEEIEALATVQEWLDGIIEGFPEPEELQRAVSIHRSISVLQGLADRHFRGREQELGIIRLQVTADAPSILFVKGAGGAGKSALLSKFLLEWVRPSSPGEPNGLKSFSRAWIRVDLDHPESDPQRPASILRMAISQLGRQIPELERLSEKVSNTIMQQGRATDEVFLESSPGVGVQGEKAAQEFRKFLEEAHYLAPGHDALSVFPLIMVIDTFEEVQFFGKEIEERFLDLFGELANKEPRLRLIICGRAAPRFEKAGGCPINIIALGDLSVENAGAVLGSLVRAADGEAVPLDKETCHKIVKRLGGNPLTLRLAASLIARVGPAAIDNEELMAEIEASSMQARLYSRILSHLHDPDLNRLAVPGLVVRRITPELIREVLAEPCGLGLIDAQRADELFEKLGHEVALVSLEDDGSLRHRHDVRQVMIQAMPSKLADQINQIDRRAAEFWLMRDGEIARSEELYHRLRLLDSPVDLEKLWSEALGKHLANVLEELEPGTPQRSWLAGKLGATLDEDERTMISHQEWERQAAKSVLRSLGSGQPQRALRVLGERPDRSEASPLYALEVRAYLLMGNLRKAKEAAQKAIATFKPAANTEVMLDLELLLSTVYEQEGNHEAAAQTLTRARRWQGQLNVPTILKVRTMVRQLGIKRRGNLKLQVTSLSRLAQYAQEIDRRYWGKHPSILREAAGEIGDAWVEGLSMAFEHFGQDSLVLLTRAELLEVLRVSGIVDEDSLARIAAGREDELRKLAASVLEESIYRESKDSMRARSELVRILQRATDKLLLGQRTDPRGREAVIGGSGEIRKTLNQKTREQLVDLLEGNLTRRSISEIARFYLGHDWGKKTPTAGRLVRQAEKTGEVGRLIKGLQQQNIGDIFLKKLGKVASYFRE